MAAAVAAAKRRSDANHSRSHGSSSSLRRGENLCRSTPVGTTHPGRRRDKIRL
nr:E3 ligase, immediate-early protein [White spot syndrome virus]